MVSWSAKGPPGVSSDGTDTCRSVWPAQALKTHQARDEEKRGRRPRSHSLRACLSISAATAFTALPSSVRAETDFSGFRQTVPLSGDVNVGFCGCRRDVMGVYASCSPAGARTARIALGAAALSERMIPCTNYNTAGPSPAVLAGSMSIREIVDSSGAWFRHPAWLSLCQPIGFVISGQRESRGPNRAPFDFRARGLVAGYHTGTA